MFSGVVIHGDSIGKELGCPTANLNISPKKTQLGDGVYAGRAFLDRKEYRAVIVIQHQIKKVEVHLLDYNGIDFYGSVISVEPIQQVSQMEKIDTVEELRAKIQSDLIRVKNVFDDEL